MIRSTDEAPATTLPSRLLRWASASLGVLSGAVLVIMLLAISADVIYRNIRGQGFGGVIEYGGIMLVVIVLLAVPWTQRRDAHVSSSVLTNYLPTRVRHAIVAVGLVISALLMAWLAWESFDITYRAYTRGTARAGIAQAPTWPARAAISLGASVVVLELARSALHHLRRVRPSTTPEAGGTADEFTTESEQLEGGL